MGYLIAVPLFYLFFLLAFRAPRSNNPVFSRYDLDYPRSSPAPRKAAPCRKIVKPKARFDDLDDWYVGARRFRLFVRILAGSVG